MKLKKSQLTIDVERYSKIKEMERKKQKEKEEEEKNQKKKKFLIQLILQN